MRLLVLISKKNKYYQESNSTPGMIKSTMKTGERYINSKLKINVDKD